MKIELLYFDDCPNWKLTRRDLEDVLRELRIDAPVEVVDVNTNAQAQELRFLGSPTVRIDGKDVDPAVGSEGYILRCRIYWVDGRAVGSPPREWILTAIRESAAV